MASIACALNENVTPLTVLDLPIHELPTVANRRSLPRVAGRFEVRMHDDDSVCRGIDLSFGGLMCVGGAPVWPGNLVSFDLVLPGEPQALVAHGRVAELVPTQGGVAMRVRFEDIAQTARKRIALWMARTHGV